MNNQKRHTYISAPTKRHLTRKRRKSPFWGNARRFIIAYKSSVLVVVILLLLCVISRLVYGFTIGRSENIIQEIVFTDEDLQMYDNKDIYTFVREQLYNKNAILVKMNNGGEAKDIVKEQYPFIDDLHISKIGPGKISVDVDFYGADLVFQNEYISIAYANKFLFPVQSQNAISSGALFLELPTYFSGEKIQLNATGYISLLNPEKLKNDFAMMKEVVSQEHILFVAGSQKSIVTAGNKRITFDHRRNITAQLEYLRQINTLEEGFFYEIDLTTFPKVIIKKTEGGFAPF